MRQRPSRLVGVKPTGEACVDSAPLSRVRLLPTILHRLTGLGTRLPVGSPEVLEAFSGDARLDRDDPTAVEVHKSSHPDALRVKRRGVVAQLPFEELEALSPPSRIGEEVQLWNIRPPAPRHAKRYITIDASEVRLNVRLAGDMVLSLLSVGRFT